MEIITALKQKMSKSYKLKDDSYISDDGILHNREKLNTFLNNFKESAIKRISEPLNFATNFNNITNVGFYMYNGWNGEDTGSNRPTDTRNMGFLIVLSHSTWNNYMQIYISSSASIKILYRMYYDGAWKNWISL